MYFCSKVMALIETDPFTITQTSNLKVGISSRIDVQMTVNWLHANWVGLNMYQKKHSGWLWFVCLNGSRFLLTPNSFRMHGLVIPSLWRGVALFKDLTSVQRRAVAPIRYSPRMSSAERRLQRVCICTCSCVCVLQDVQKHVLENSNAICTSPNYITLYVYIYNYVYTVLVLLARFSPR